METIELPLQTRADVRLAPDTIDAQARTVELVWSTGAPVRRRDLFTGRRYDEVLSLDRAHVDLSRLNAGAPLLNAHGAYNLLNVLGVVERAWIVDGSDGPQGRAIVRFSEREDVEPLWQDVQAGIIRSVSVGYAVRAYEVIEEDGEVPLWRAVDWQPLELSAVPIGADQAAGFRHLQHLTPCHLIHRAAAAQQPEIKAMDPLPPAADSRTDIATVTSEDSVSREMPETKPRSDEPQVQNSCPADNFGPDAAGTEDIARRVLVEERARIAGIYDAARKLGLDQGLADTLVRDGASLDQARGLLIDKAAERDRSIETRPHIRTGGLDERETRRSAVETALLHRFDPHRYALTEPARDWRGYSLIEMARTFLEGEGVRVRGLPRDEIATRALHTTSDFPHILAAVTNKTLRDAYEAAPRTFQPIARRATAADFKEMHRVQLGEAPQLEKVNETGEFKRGTIGEGKERYRVETWGKVIGITRQVIINDDLDAFTRVPSLFGTAAATLESDVVWGIVTSNPAMADGVALFHANHKNLTGTGTALDVANLGKARTAMAKQTGLDGKTVLNIRPAFLVVPSSLELTAEQMIAQNLVPATVANVVPASIRSLAVIAEPRLDPASGAVPWYLFASPSAIDTIEYAYLEGQDGVFIETRIGFDVDGVEIKARLDFGAKAIDWRGMHKNAGVAL
ncbi:MAG: Mu-like prophage major head subunit gpT family protein [Defluviicoccus sp.]|nr:Mu-like prophage major head subunit gpT family protein [Defluviicoccus sp.]MDG4591527.1 Mu-like prophage major head subunit gpT family protein [Defluviicoccus sp.]